MTSRRLAHAALDELTNRQQGLDSYGCRLSYLKGGGTGLRHPLGNQETGSIRKHDVDLLPPRPPRLGDLELAARMAVESVVDPDSSAIPHKWGVLFGFACQITITSQFALRRHLFRGR